MYAKLCKVINENLSDYYEQNNLKNIFKLALLRKCKEEFENRRTAFESFENQDAPLSIDDEEKRSIAKQKMLCNIKFICELGKQQLLPKNILHECIKELLSKKKNQTNKDKTQDLECLCEIMKNIGHLLEDNDEAKLYLDQYFARMEVYSKSAEINSRIKFMLLDVIDLRKNNWIPRQKEVLNSSISENNRIERDHNNGVLSPYGTLYPLRPNSLLGNPRHDDVFSHVPLGHIYLGTGPGAINDTNFLLNNQRRSNFQKNPPFLGGGGGGPNNYPMNMNNQMKRDSNYRNQNYSNNNNMGGGGGNNINNPGRDGNNMMNNSSYSSGPSNMNNLNQSNLQREQSNLPPRFQKHHQQTNKQQQNNLSFPSFLNKNSNNMMNNDNNDRNMMMNRPNNMNLNMKMMNDNQNKNFKPHVPNPFINNNNNSNNNSNKPMNAFNKFINPAQKLNGKDSGIVNDMNQMKLDENNVSANNVNNVNSSNNDSSTTNDGNNKTEVNVFFEIEKLLSDYYVKDNSEPIINYIKTSNVNFDEILLSIMRISIGKNEKERDMTNKLLNKIKSDSVVSDAIFINSLKNLFSKINELEVETPRARSYVAAFIANAIVENVITLKEIGDLLDGGLHYPLFPLILQNLHKAKDQTWLFDLFSESKINLMQMVPENDRNRERMADILEDRNLTFLYPMLRIESDITKQITSDCSPNSLYRWLKDNVNTTLQSSPEFISVVFSTLLKHIIAKHNNPDNPFVFTGTLFANQENELRKYSQVLQVFLSGKQDLQLIVLYSLQTYCHEHNFPKGLIEKWFNMLYEHEIVDDEVFLKWREDINDEYPGKGNALFRVNKWLTWLEEEEDDEEEED